MNDDDELCLCFHVTRRKVINYLRVERPSRWTQMSDCYGAGTGCGWCRPFLKRLFEESRRDAGPTAHWPSADEYAQARAKYVRLGKGTPPQGATPLPE